jgi:hypothetical protein
LSAECRNLDKSEAHKLPQLRANEYQDNGGDAQPTTPPPSRWRNRAD